MVTGSGATSRVNVAPARVSSQTREYEWAHDTSNRALISCTRSHSPSHSEGTS